MIPTEAAANKPPVCRAVVTWRDGRAAIHRPARSPFAPDRRLQKRNVDVSLRYGYVL